MLAECGACRQMMTIGEGHLGQQVSCPACGSMVQIAEVVPSIAVAPTLAATPSPRYETYAGSSTPPVSNDGGSVLVHRCPRCHSEVEHGNFLCPRCGVNIRRARRRHR